MTDNHNPETRLEELETRLARLEEIFAPNLLDRQTRHVSAQSHDARDIISPGDQKEMRVISPVGDGKAPDQCVGKIHGVVTFVDDEAEVCEEDAVVMVEVISVSHSSAEAVLVN